KVFLMCDPRREYRNRNHDESTRQRRLTGTRKTKCPFSVAVTESDGQWQVNVRDSEYSHDESVHAHPAGRRDDIQKDGVHDIVYAQMKAGIRARDTVRTLRQIDADMSVTRRDVHDLRAEIKRNELNGPSPIQALQFQLDGLIH
ncbi:hypothetical protein V1525DRAFT_346076, partial [Lipomyces kononenkoae]